MSNPTEPSADAQQVLDALEQEGKKYRARRKWRLWLACGWGLTLLLLLALNKFFDVQVPGYVEFIVNLALPCLGYTSLSHRWALKKAARNGDKETAPFLLEALVMPDKEIRKAAQWSLTKSLPTLTDDDQSIFDPYQRGILYRQLGALVTSRFGPNGPPFIEAVLNAIHRTGGAEAVPYIEDFEQRARRRGGAWRKLADHALLVLPDLRMRAAKQIIDKKVDEVTTSSEFDRERLEKLRDSGDILGKEDHERSRLGADSTGAG